MKHSVAQFVSTLVLVVALVLAPAAVAAKGGKPGGGGGGSSSLSLVLLNSSDGLPHWGQQVTFNVSTSATSYPYVRVTCTQAGALVYSMSAGFFDSYPWPGERIFTLKSMKWSSGAADCLARLYSSGRRETTLATLNFRVHA